MLLAIGSFLRRVPAQTSGPSHSAMPDPRARHRIALPLGSPLRQAVNLAVLDAVESEWWQQTKFQYLSRR
jgi:hypothetical protein